MRHGIIRVQQQRVLGAGLCLHILTGKDLHAGKRDVKGCVLRADGDRPFVRFDGGQQLSLFEKFLRLRDEGFGRTRDRGSGNADLRLGRDDKTVHVRPGQHEHGKQDDTEPIGTRPLAIHAPFTAFEIHAIILPSGTNQSQAGFFQLSFDS
jgi:hypothetical protein